MILTVPKIIFLYINKKKNQPNLTDQNKSSSLMQWDQPGGPFAKSHH